MDPDLRDLPQGAQLGVLRHMDFFHRLSPSAPA
jgi:hypothetical protein